MTIGECKKCLILLGVWCNSSERWQKHVCDAIQTWIDIN
jgi:hypothetical protein